MEPEQHPILELQWGGPQPVTIPEGGLSGNMGNGKATGLLQSNRNVETESSSAPK